MAKSSTTTHSETDTLYFTDDLNGKLDLDHLQGKTVAGLSLDQIYDKNDEQPAELKSEPTKATVTLKVAGRVEISITGTLNAISFGKGWLCSIEGVDEETSFEMVKAWALYKNLTSVIVNFACKDFELSGDLDFTIGYSFGGCTFAVSADEGSYLSSQ